MKYFLDTEFIEGFNKPIFGKRRHFIDLISIGIISEDGRTYSAISNEYKYEDADSWVKENVIIPMYTKYVHGDERNMLDANNFHKKYGKSNDTIAKEIINFINPCAELACKNYGSNKVNLDKHNYSQQLRAVQPEFYGYYCDYDWVLFCSLFGRMIDLPKGFPMYCIDLKQMLDELAAHYFSLNTDNTLEDRINALKGFSSYPKQSEEHDALCDAKFNKDLYHFIKNK